MPAAILTDRHRLVLRSLARGQSESHISEDLDLTQAEFNDVLEQLFGRLGVSSRVELILLTYSELRSAIALKTGT